MQEHRRKSIDRKELVCSFLRALFKAARRIGKVYFKVPVYRPESGSAELPYRERVYCYELYHQLRCVLKKVKKAPVSGKAVIYGEMDKRGTDYAEKIPDFIFHVPGTQGNYVVMEVKHVNCLSRLGDDFEKLRNFLVGTEKYPRYIMGVEIIYGDTDIKRLCSTVLENFEIYFQGKSVNLLVLWHRKPSEYPTVLLNHTSGYIRDCVNSLEQKLGGGDVVCKEVM